MFRAAAVVRAIAVHNINVKNKLARVLLRAIFSESKPRQTGARMIRFGGTDDSIAVKRRSAIKLL